MKLSFCGIAALASSLFSLHAEVLTVDNRPNAVAMFTDLGAAIAAAENNDTIQIAGSSTHYGGHEVHKPLHFRGPGYFLGENQVEGLNQKSAQVALTFTNDSNLGSASGSTASHLEGSFNGNSSTGLVSFTLTHCKGSASGISNFSNLPRITATKCFLGQFLNMAAGSMVSDSVVAQMGLNAQCVADRCIFLSTSWSDELASISDSIFIVTSTATFFTDHEGSVSHCMAIGGNYLPAANGNVNEQFANVVFTQGASPDGYYRLKPNSPARSIGRNGGDLGAFGGVNPYRLSGLPSIPRITNLSIDAVATDANGLTFNVDAVAVGTTSE